VHGLGEARDVEELPGRGVLAVRLPGLVVALATGILLLAACQKPPASAPGVSAVETDALVLGRAALKRGDHAVAVALLRDALRARADVLEAHYLLAVSASHLDQGEEAGREFEWVVAHGDPGSAEVSIAREWLASRRPMAAATVPLVDDPSPVQNAELASLSGKAEDAGGSKRRLLLFLKGVRGAAVEDEYRTLRTDGQGRYRFANVVPGEYLLTNAVAGPVTWRLRVSLARGEHRTLDLSPSNDTSVRDDAPETR
jgi:hypothetical protein